MKFTGSMRKKNTHPSVIWGQRLLIDTDQTTNESAWKLINHHTPLLYTTEDLRRAFNTRGRGGSCMAAGIFSNRRRNELTSS